MALDNNAANTVMSTVPMLKVKQSFCVYAYTDNLFCRFLSWTYYTDIWMARVNKPNSRAPMSFR